MSHVVTKFADVRVKAARGARSAGMPAAVDMGVDTAATRTTGGRT